jgi:2-haloacid dehalogenase
MAQGPIQALVFDAYGTLFDVHSVVRRCDELFPGKGLALSQLWRTKQLEYTWLRSLMSRYEDFASVTRAALRYATAALALECGPSAEAALMDEYLRLAPYPEVPSALDELRSCRLAILSNGSPSMLQAVVKNAGLEAAFREILSVDPLRVYKPHPSVYQLAVDRLGVPKEQVGFISSNFWDVTGATSFGFRTFWVNRTGALPDELGFRPAAVLNSLAALPSALS